MPDTQITRFNLSAQLPAFKTVLEGQLPARLLTEGLPAIARFLIGEPSLVKGDEFPCCTLSADMKTRQAYGGGITEPQTDLVICCGFGWTGNDDGYIDGLAMAEIAMRVLMDNEGEVGVYTGVLRDSLAVRPVWEEGVWQGAIAIMNWTGADVNWNEADT